MLPNVKLVSVAMGGHNRRFLNGGFEYSSNSDPVNCSGPFDYNANVDLGAVTLSAVNQGLEFVLNETIYTRARA